MRCYFCGIIVDKVPHAMMRDAPKVGPIPQRTDGGFFILWENPAAAQAEDIRELAFIRRE